MVSVYKRQDLLSFLKQAVTSAVSFAARAGSSRTQVFVFGNTSADLDSIVSSIIWSYFATNSARQYIPIVNLPHVSSGAELRRLRPELMVALKLALSTSKSTLGDNDEEVEAGILKYGLLTTKDLRELLKKEENSGERRRLDVMMVDWNAMPNLSTGRGIPGLSDALKDSLDLSIVGCIDHHYDEGFVSSAADPRRIQIPIGSCTSLIINEIRSRALWHEPGEDHIHHKHPDAAANEAQAAKLALSSILIDTINMTEEHKVSETDIEEVVFLEDKVRYAISVAESTDWDRKNFYDRIAEAKESSVNNLTMQEILGRDYKEWLEELNDKPGKSVKVGIMNVGKPLLWILQKAKASLTTLLDEVQEFATARNLDVAAIMTAFSDKNGNFNRELALFAFDPNVLDKAELFETHGISNLGLTAWKKTTTEETHEEIAEQDFLLSYKQAKVPLFKVWQQRELAKSRKQVAPLLRKTLTGHL
ncbi:Exopolyphosphatase [Ascosphaera aggregata]|nr:Exopolyphosphatase [Ascosphaera aggregata]